MSNDDVYLLLDEPAVPREAASSVFVMVGGREVQLPQKLTRLDAGQDGMTQGVYIPRWLAEKEGLVQNEAQDTMSRDDWFLLGCTMAMLIRGEPTHHAAWEGKKLAKQLLEER